MKDMPQKDSYSFSVHEGSGLLRFYSVK